MNEQYLGLTEEAAIQLAKENGTRYRIVQRDDVHFIVTMDYVISRLNFTIKDGKVVHVKLG